MLVLAGASGTGKSTAAWEIARRHGIPWMQVDDLRLSLERSRDVVPRRADRLTFFDTPDVWTLPVEELVRAFVGVAEVMVSAVRVVIDSHVVTDVPLVLEGDGVLPALVEDPVLRSHVVTGRVRFCTVVEARADVLLENMAARGRGMDVGDIERHTRHAGANAAFGAWLVQQSTAFGIPVVPSRPFETLPDRILTAIGQGRGGGGTSL